jgi:hypothetical protein
LRRLVAAVLIGLLVVGTVLAYLSRPTSRVDPNAPRVVMEVGGMHCPIQCGLRVESALEALPWVVPGSVTANTKAGVVTFAVTDQDAVRESEIRRVVERAGFRVRSVTLPHASPRALVRKAVAVEHAARRQPHGTVEPPAPFVTDQNGTIRYEKPGPDRPKLADHLHRDEQPQGPQMARVSAPTTELSSCRWARAAGRV